MLNEVNKIQENKYHMITFIQVSNAQKQKVEFCSPGLEGDRTREGIC